MGHRLHRSTVAEIAVNQNISCHRLYRGTLKPASIASLLSIYINNVDDYVCSNLLKFADHTKVFSVVSTKDDNERLQVN